MSVSGLVVLSAKYGIPSEDGTLIKSEQVADVTTAVAALIDDSVYNNGPALVIPHGVRKSRLPGFWDPAPGLDKVLRVEYMFKGEAGAVEVGSRDELVLPPQA
jgi:DnaJ family protein C protein 11